MDNLRIPIKPLMTLLILSAFIFGWFTHQATEKRIIQREQAALSDQLNVRASLINSRLEKDRSSVRFLYSTPPIQGIVRATQFNNIDPKDGTQLIQWKFRLETIFEAFLENNPAVSQARYIGVANGGMELVRVDRQSGNVKVRRQNQLQKKGHRDYFKAIGELGENQVYVSEINLNQERGEIVIPYEPTYRVGIPVFDDQQHLFGMVVLNVDARPLLISLSSGLPSQTKLLLLNETGGFIAHPRVGYAFQHEIGGEANFSTEFVQGVDKKIKARWLDSLVTGQRFYYDRLPIPLAHGKEHRFMDLVVMLPQSWVSGQLFQQSTQSLMIGAAVLALVLLFLGVFQSNVSKNLRLLDTQAQFESIIEGSADAIIAINERRKITLWNTSAQDMLGHSARHVQGQALQHVLNLSDRNDQFNTALNAVMAGSHQQPIRLVLKKRNQMDLHVSVSLSPIMRSGKAVGAAAIFRDISAEIDAENQVREINASLEDQVKVRTFQLEEAKNEALSASRTKSSFIANVSHEIRTPLNGIVGMLNLIRKSSDPQQINRYLNLADTSAGTLSALINDVLDLSKIEAGSLEMDSSDYDLRRRLSDIVASMSVRAFEKNLEVILDTSLLAHPHLYGDGSRVAQVFTNLIGNAIKFTDSGWVRVKVSSEQGSEGNVIVRATVDDTGIGVAQEKLADIFEAFSQEDNSVTREFGGTGLGLSITRQLCQLMGGDITVSSTKGEGSSFEFEIIQSQSAGSAESVRDPDLAEMRCAIFGGSEPLAEGISNQLYTWNAKSVDHFYNAPDDLTNESSVKNSGLETYDLILVDDSLANQFQGVVTTYPLTLMIHHMNLTKQYADALCFEQQIHKPVTVYELMSLFVEQDAQPDNRLHKSKKQTAGVTEKLSGARILLVDDNRINQEVAIGLIEDYGVEIAVASNGKQALELLASAPQDLVLMDCQMPVMDGYTATQQIRSGVCGEAMKSVPILAMTASAMAGDKERCSNAGMDDYMTKPLDPAILESKLLF